MTLLIAVALAVSPPDAVSPPVVGPWSSHDVADLDGDGVRDLIWVVDDDLLMWPGVLGGPPVGGPTAYATGTGTYGISVTGDFDGDGFDDALVSRDLGGLAGYRGQVGGPVAAPWVLPTTFLRAFALGDVNGDGFDDVIIDGQVWTGSAAGPVPYGPDLSAWWDRPPLVWALGDVDGDGYDDFAFGGPKTFVNYYSSEAELVFMVGGPTGPTVSWTYGRPELDCGFEVTLADVDGDGAKDLVVTCINQVDESGIGVFDVLVGIDTPYPGVLGSSSFSVDVGNGFDLATLDDWDSDGADEVVFGTEGRLTQARWDAVDGLVFDGLSPQWPHPSNWGLAWISTDDISGDGRGDMAVTFYDDGIGQRSTSVWLGPLGFIPKDTGEPTDTGTPTTTDTGTASTPSTIDTATGDTAIFTPGAGSGDPVADVDKDDGCGCSQPGAASWWSVWQRR